jgi:hypothetical protein
LACYFVEGQCCKDCVRSAVSKAKHFGKDSIGVSSVVFLGSYMNNRSFKMFSQERGISEMQSFSLQGMAYKLNRDMKNNPFYCLLDNKLNASHFFIPDINNPSLTDEYLNIVKILLENDTSKQ